MRFTVSMFLASAAVLVGMCEGRPVQPQPRRFMYQKGFPSVRLYPVYPDRVPSASSNSANDLLNNRIDTHETEHVSKGPQFLDSESKVPKKPGTLKPEMRHPETKPSEMMRPEVMETEMNEAAEAAVKDDEMKEVMMKETEKMEPNKTNESVILNEDPEMTMMVESGGGQEMETSTDLGVVEEDSMPTMVDETSVALNRDASVTEEVEEVTENMMIMETENDMAAETEEIQSFQDTTIVPFQEAPESVDNATDTPSEDEIATERYLEETVTPEILEETATEVFPDVENNEAL